MTEGALYRHRKPIRVKSDSDCDLDPNSNDPKINSFVTPDGKTYSRNVSRTGDDRYLRRYNDPKARGPVVRSEVKPTINELLNRIILLADDELVDSDQDLLVKAVDKLKSMLPPEPMPASLNSDTPIRLETIVEADDAIDEFDLNFEESEFGESVTGKWIPRFSDSQKSNDSDLVQISLDRFSLSITLCEKPISRLILYPFGFISALTDLYSRLPDTIELDYSAGVSSGKVNFTKALSTMIEARGEVISYVSGDEYQSIVAMQLPVKFTGSFALF